MPFRRSPKLSYSPTGAEIFQLIGYRTWSQPTGSIKAVKRGDVVRRHQAALVVGHAFEVARYYLERIRPGRVRMREVRPPHQVFDTDEMTRHHADAVVLKSCGDLPPKIIAGRIRDRLLFEIAILLKRVVETLQKMRNPSDVVFNRHKLEIGEAF